MHRQIGREIADRGTDILITVGEMAGEIAEGAREGGMRPDRISVTAGHAEAAKSLFKSCPRDSIVLLKGSRKARMEDVLRCFTTCSTR